MSGVADKISASRTQEPPPIRVFRRFRACPLFAQRVLRIKIPRIVTGIIVAGQSQMTACRKFRYSLRRESSCVQRETA